PIYDAETVAAVGGQIEFDAAVVQREILADVLPQRGIGGQLQQSVGALGESQFLGGAKHAVRLDAAQLGLADPDLGVLGLQRRAYSCEGDTNAGTRVGGTT